jgi:F0F1-type ATP synthase delta subunit
LAKDIASYLLFEHKTAQLEPLMRDIMQYRLDHGIVEADVMSAHELSDAISTELKQLLKQQYPSAKQVTLHEKHNEQVVGGVRVQLPSEQLDLSIADKLARFKRLTSDEVVA